MVCTAFGSASRRCMTTFNTCMSDLGIRLCGWHGILPGVFCAKLMSSKLIACSKQAVNSCRIASADVLNTVCLLAQDAPHLTVVMSICCVNKGNMLRCGAAVYLSAWCRWEGRGGPAQAQAAEHFWRLDRHGDRSDQVTSNLLQTLAFHFSVQAFSLRACQQ